MSIVIFLIILAILILVHEFGHFIVAKKSGVRVDEFGLGFPPKVVAKKFGETTYTLNLIPFGGFVKIFGEDPHAEEIAEADKPRSFFYKPKWVQALILVAGVTMNVIFAWLLISLGFMIGLPASPNHGGFGEVRDVNLVVTEVVVDSPAAIAGLVPGDTILFAGSGSEAVQGEELTPQNMKELISGSEGTIEILYARGDDAPRTAFVEPSSTILEGEQVIGISMDNVGLLKLPVHLALAEGARTTWLLTKATVIGLAVFLWDVVTFNSDFSQVSGPVGIASIVSEASNLGFVYLLSFTALISINLAVINLLPFPALDGGRLLFILIEVVTRRAIPPGFVRWTNAIGFLLLLLLMAIITVNDILKLV